MRRHGGSVKLGIIIKTGSLDDDAPGGGGMSDETTESDDHRPLSPEERRALRQLISRKEDILDVATNFSHLGWAAQFALKLAKWVTGIVAGLIAYKTFGGSVFGGPK